MGIVIAISAYFLNAVTIIVDKFLLRRSIPDPVVYGFYMGILSIFALPLFLYDFQWPGLIGVAFNIMIGFIFLTASLVLFIALKKDEASRAIPIIGGITPIFIFLLSHFLNFGKLSAIQIIACFVLVLGSVTLSLKNNKQGKKKIEFKGLLLAGISGLLFAGFYVFSDYAYETQSFVSAFTWMRLGSFLGAVLLIAGPKTRLLILKNTRKVKPKSVGLLITNKIIAGVAFIFLNYAVFLQSSLIVNALQGVQYAILFLMTILLTSKFPHIIKEEITPSIALIKTGGIILIGVGIAGLFL